MVPVVWTITVEMAHLMRKIKWAIKASLNTSKHGTFNGHFGQPFVIMYKLLLEGIGIFLLKIFNGHFRRFWVTLFLERLFGWPNIFNVKRRWKLWGLFVQKNTWYSLSAKQVKVTGYEKLSEVQYNILYMPFTLEVKSF